MSLLQWLQQPTFFLAVVALDRRLVGTLGRRMALLLTDAADTHKHTRVGTVSLGVTEEDQLTKSR